MSVGIMRNRDCSQTDVLAVEFQSHLSLSMKRVGVLDLARGMCPRTGREQGCD